MKGSACLALASVLLLHGRYYLSSMVMRTAVQSPLPHSKRIINGSLKRELLGDKLSSRGGGGGRRGRRGRRSGVLQHGCHHHQLSRGQPHQVAGPRGVDEHSLSRGGRGHGVRGWRVGTGLCEDASCSHDHLVSSCALGGGQGMLTKINFTALLAHCAQMAAA